jgi:hypothetical protein
MPALDAAAVFERHFLETRCKLLEVAANLDRIDRAAGDVAADPRRIQVAKAIEILASDAPDRAERLQMLFSRPYDPDWIAAERMEFPRPASSNGKRS